MKITKRQLRKIIKEEIEHAAEGLTYSQHGQESGPDDDGGYDRGLAQLLDQGDISQEEYDAKLTPARG